MRSQLSGNTASQLPKTQNKDDSSHSPSQELASDNSSRSDNCLTVKEVAAPITAPTITANIAPNPIDCTAQCSPPLSQRAWAIKKAEHFQNRYGLVGPAIN